MILLTLFSVIREILNNLRYPPNKLRVLKYPCPVGFGNLIMKISYVVVKDNAVLLSHGFT